jgi:hypothetical protein
MRGLKLGFGIAPGGRGEPFIELEAGQGVIIVTQLLPLGDDLDAVAGNEENIIIQEAA